MKFQGLRRLLTSGSLMLAGLAGGAWAGETQISLGIRESGGSEDAEVYLRRITDRGFGPLDLAYGVAVTAEGAVWAGLGLRAKWELGRTWYASASVMPGLRHRGDGPDLGHTIQFRSDLEIGRSVGAGRLGIGIDHISNAGIGDDNPGSDSLFLRYRLPLR